MSSPAAPPFQPRPRAQDRLAAVVESGARTAVVQGAVLARSAFRGLRSGLQLLREDGGAMASRGEARRAHLLAELEEAQRLGRWHTAEDQALVREHEARLAAEARAATLRGAGRRGSVALLVIAWFVPLLWPLAIAGSFLAFPRTSRRLLVGLVALGAASALALTLLLGQVLRGDGEPPVAPLPPASWGTTATPGAGERLADRLEREADYWEYVAPAQEGPGMLRKGVFRTWEGRPVMVIPRASWQALSPGERRALADHLRLERGVEAIYVGRLMPSTRFQGQAIAVEQRVWP
ncbi:MAG: hypothetical protein ACK522_05095 [Synechococcaceae cyanobacterium]